MSVITLAYQFTTLTLPGDLHWSDELAWSAVQQTLARSVTGALLVQTGTRIAGRPITLEPPIAERTAWMSRATLDVLHTWAQTPGLQMVLVLRGSPRTVIWRHDDGPVIEASKTMHWDDIEPADTYTARLKFLELA